jgi:hypothetical protein
MTEHSAFIEYRDEFLSYSCFAKFHRISEEKARELIAKGREVENQIQQIKNQIQHTK